MTLATEYARVCTTPSDIQNHLPRFVQLCHDMEAEHVIELGTRTGVSTIAWLYALENRGSVTSIDIDAPPPLTDCPHWSYIQGDDLDPRIVDQLWPADIVFIDTSHFYEQTKAELATYRGLVKPGGRILCHDTQLRRPLGSPARPLFPVRTAVQEFCEQHDLIWHEYPDSWGLAVIEIPEVTHG